jgi:hypothetical protein
MHCSRRRGGREGSDAPPQPPKLYLVAVENPLHDLLAHPQPRIRGNQHRLIKHQARANESSSSGMSEIFHADSYNIFKVLGLG